MQPDPRLALVQRRWAHMSETSRQEIFLTVVWMAARGRLWLFDEPPYHQATVLGGVGELEG